MTEQKETSSDNLSPPSYHDDVEGEAEEITHQHRDDSNADFESNSDNNLNANTDNNPNSNSNSPPPPNSSDNYTSVNIGSDIGDIDSSLTRKPPYNNEAEMGLLGAVLGNNRLYEKIADFLYPKHFANAINGNIFEAIMKLIDRGQIADPITIKAYLEQEEKLEHIGGTAYLAELAAASTTTINVYDYAKLLYDLHLRRELIDIGDDVINEAYTHDLDISAENQIENVEAKLFNLAETGGAQRNFVSFGEALTESIATAERAHKQDGQISGVPTGFKNMDNLLGGLHNSDLIILAARPSMGKTALATNIAFNAATKINPDGTPYHVAFFSLEMSAEQLATRILAERTEISSEKIRRGMISSVSSGGSPSEWERIIETSAQLEKTPLFIDDTPALGVAGLRSRARRLKRQKGLDMIIVDYLQLMTHNTGRGGAENRVQEISAITRGLKTIAKELNIPVIALSQLSRAVEQRENKRPQLSDLRESGSIEQDADVVMFIFREEYYLAREVGPYDVDAMGTEMSKNYEEKRARLEQVQNISEIIVSKQRHGPIGTVMMRFEGMTTRFSDLQTESHLPEQNF